MTPYTSGDTPASKRPAVRDPQGPGQLINGYPPIMGELGPEAFIPLQPRMYTLTYEQRPWLMNADKSLHWAKRHALITEWKQAFTWLCKVQRVPRLDAVNITVRHERKDGRAMADVGATFPAFKAALDGIVEAKVLDHDGPEVVRSLTFAAPEITGREALTVVLWEAL